MNTITIGRDGPTSSRIVHGCMRLSGDGSREAHRKAMTALETAVESGINHFDHADIYGNGSCEMLFGEFLTSNPGLRDNLIITSKCGIRSSDMPQKGDPRRYDLSASHIINSVDGSLRRLRIERLDILLLHRPDHLMDPGETAGAFERLHNAGKVSHFGVSNFSTSQVNMLLKYSSYPLLINQVEFNIHRISPLNDGILDQCIEKDISPQSWCPMGGVAYPAWGNTLTEHQTGLIHAELEAQAERYECDKSMIILAWILRHPARILPITGTMSPDRIRNAVNSVDLPYSRNDWYSLLDARAGSLP